VALKGFVLQLEIQIIQACLQIYDDIYLHDLFISSKYPIVITLFDVSPSATDDINQYIICQSCHFFIESSFFSNNTPPISWNLALIISPLIIR